MPSHHPQIVGFVPVLVVILLLPASLASSSLSEFVSSTRFSVVTQNPDDNDYTPPTIELLAPRDGEYLDYGPIDIRYNVYDTSGIQSVVLIVDDRVINITRFTTSYEWHPTRDGITQFTLNCTDNALNTASISFTVYVLVRSTASPMLGVAAFVILLGFGALVFRTRTMHSPHWKEDPDFGPTVFVPVSYVIRSHLYRLRKKVP
ncbi:MAG: Ig-like domain-containing protein [Candidatus Thorarchaeota archaeon]